MDIFGLEPSAPSSRFNALAWGFRSARVLQVAVRLKLFTLLEERPCDSGMLAKGLSSDNGMTERLLIALAGLNLVRHDEGTWRNTLASSLYLVAGQIHYQGDVIEMAAREWQRYHDLERLVREGRGEESTFTLGQDPEVQSLYLKAVHGLAVAGMAQRAARMVPLAGRRTLLDISGAPGTWSVAFAQRFAALRVALLVDAAMVSDSKTLLAQFDVAKQVSVKAAAWRERGFGTNRTEAVLLSNVSASTDGSTLTGLMRAYDALKAHGIVIVHTWLLDNDLNGGGEAAYRSLTGEACTLEQFISLMEEAGFERISLLYRHPFDGDLLVGYKPDESLLHEPEELVEVATPERALVGAGNVEYDEDVLLATHRRAWSGSIERLN